LTRLAVVVILPPLGHATSPGNGEAVDASARRAAGE
jgi:hypothetical protein